jgi:predicted Zn-dependent peptidase
MMHKLALPDQKIGRSILGTAEVIARVPRAALTTYVSRHYVGANMVLVAAGKISHEAFLKMVEERFGKLPRGKKPVEEKTSVSFGARLLPKDIEQVHLILGFAGPGYHAGPSYYATQVLSLILGGSASSRLFQKVREKRGLVYTINSAHAGFSDAGIFEIYAGTDPKRLREVIPVICDEMLDIKKNVTTRELARAKAQVRADLLMGKESVMRRAEVMGNQILAFGKPVPAETILQKLLSVSEENVKTAAHRLFSRKPILTALGPLEELEDYKSICARLA